MDKLPSLAKLGVKFADVNNMPLGTDAELFMTSPKGKVFSAHKVNMEPKVDKYNRNRSLLIRDGAALELHFAYGIGCREELASVIKDALHQAVALAEKSNATVSCAPALPILKSHLRGAPDDVKEGGCQPDRSAYTGQVKSGFGYVDDVRFAGGHMHFGIWQNISNDLLQTHMDQLIPFLDRITVLLDWAVSIPFVAMLGKTFANGEAERRRYYGQAGSYRFQDWGYEYRVPSSRILLSPALLTLVYGMARSAIQSVIGRSGFYYDKQFLGELVPKIDIVEKVIDALDFDFNEVQRIINEHDYAAAQNEWQNGVVGAFWNRLVDNDYRPYTRAVDLIVNAEQNGINFESKDFMRAWGAYRGSNGIATCMAFDPNRRATSWDDPSTSKIMLPQLALQSQPVETNDWDNGAELEDDGMYPDDVDYDYDDDYEEDEARYTEDGILVCGEPDCTVCGSGRS